MSCHGQKTDRLYRASSQHGADLPLMQGSTGGLAATGGCLQHRTSGLAVQLARSKVLQQEVIDLSHTCYNLIFVSGRHHFVSANPPF